eukprot:TRINITY_DN111647_c0_g1_i1.p1 TRINITY_DN111647_c0_g1~~TRINITY_DN111647_c0_g1_i1.p1  ORF type:complete len:403 (-),score=137.54 TRINITY_DN111647_c0_g1_i1:145-1353(-)
MAQEHQEYIQSKVNPILESLVTEVLLERPENPVPFMVRWLAERSKTGKNALNSLGVGEAESLRVEIKSLQEEISQLQNKVAAPGGEAPKAAAKDEDASEEEDDDDDEGEEVEWTPPPASYMKKARASVSAEAYGAFNVQKEYVPPVHEKTAEATERIKKTLSVSWLFNTLDSKNFDIIVGAMIEKKIEAGERLIQEGDDGDVMFLIESGTFDCIKKIDGAEKVVKQCAKGDFFGELALLYNTPRAASVQANEPGVVWQLDRESFNAIVRDAARKRREALVEFLKQVPLLKNLGDLDRMQLADVLRPQEVEAGSNVVSQGEDAENFYIIEEGELAAVKNGEEKMSYKAGDYFGELALLRNEARAATVVAKTKATLAVLKRKEFHALLNTLKAEMEELAKAYKP